MDVRVRTIFEIKFSNVEISTINFDIPCNISFIPKVSKFLVDSKMSTKKKHGEP